jgi:N-acyl-D-amino-acid deacylase
MTSFVTASHSRPVTWAQESDATLTEQAQAAVSSGIQNLVKAAENYPSHADCFSCHHQTLPLAALTLCEKSKAIDLEAVLGKSPSKVAEEITQFTRESFLAGQRDLDAGKPVDGRAQTLGYGMWVFALANSSQDSIAQSLRRNAMLTQSQDGCWDYHSFRPPASSSKAMATALTLFGIRQLDRQSQDNRGQIAPDFDEKSAKARGWLNEVKMQPSMEEQVGALWCRILTAPEQRLDNTAIQKMVDSLRNLQRQDGGWAQEPNMTSDAYATGQALVMMAELLHPSHRTMNQRTMNSTTDRTEVETQIRSDEAFQKGVRYLLASQTRPGAWHVKTRAEPVQPFFDNGDPFEKDQFVSIMATSWSTIALTSFLVPTISPLSLQSVN